MSSNTHTEALPRDAQRRGVPARELASRSMARYALAAATVACLLLASSGGAAAEQARTSVVATGLEAPWELVFLPDRRALLTERPGRVVLFSRGFRTRRVVATVEVDTGGRKEGGLLGLAIDPAFRRNGLVYLYRTARNDENEVLRYRLVRDRLLYRRRI